MARPDPPPNWPQITDNNRRDTRMMEVTYRVGHGRYAVVSVPYESWIQGHHTPAGKHLANMLAELDLQSERIASSLP